jgi:membrane protease YdiL (CAAX protease family)
MKEKHNTTQLFNTVPDSYLERTSRPVYAIIFLLPFIVVYELGTILINTDILQQYWQGRVVAFSWIQNFFEYLGFTDKTAWVVTPLAVILILVTLQLASRKGWRVYLGDMFPMAGECVLLAIPLIVLGLFLNSPATQPDNAVASSQQISLEAIPRCTSVTNEYSSQTDENGKMTRVIADIVTSIGAGIYEELVFRLILICALMIVFQDIFGLSHSNSIVFSVLVSAGLFSAYHHVDFLSGQLYRTGPLNWTEFGFRTVAGIYFAGIFAMRGFGITAGSHACYDIIATLINAVFFSEGI